MTSKIIDIEKIPDSQTVGTPTPGHIRVYADDAGALKQVDENGNTSDVSGVGTNSFAVVNTPAGTDPAASSPADTLNLTSADGSIVITGNSATDTIDFALGAVALADIPAGTANQVLGTNAAGNAAEQKTISGTASQVIVTHGAGSITLSTPQNIATTSEPTFKNVNLQVGTTVSTAKSDGLITMASLGFSEAPLTNPAAGSTTHTIATLPLGTFYSEVGPDFGNINEVEVEFSGIFAANGNSKRIRLQLKPDSVSPAVQIYDSGSVAQNGGSFHIRAILSPMQEFDGALNTTVIATMPATSTMNRVEMTNNADPGASTVGTLVQVILTGVAVDDVDLYSYRIKYVPTNVPTYA